MVEGKKNSKAPLIADSDHSLCYLSDWLVSLNQKVIKILFMNSS